MKLKKGKKIISLNIRFLVRRANAYLKQGQIFSAKSDIKQALDIDPNDLKIVKILNQYNTLK